MSHESNPQLLVSTQHGSFIATYSPNGLTGLEFPGKTSSKKARPTNLPPALRQWHRLTEQAVNAVLAGRTPKELPPFDVSSGTKFQRQVWEELTWIPCGETRSYAEIAKGIRKPKASRAVGGACGANPIPLLIPCHRVLAASGKIGGFSGGLEWKQRLLSKEGVAVK